MKECNGLFNDLRETSKGVKDEFLAKEGDLYMNVSKLCIDITKEIYELKRELARIDTSWINKKVEKGDFKVNSEELKKYNVNIKIICYFLKNKIIVDVKDNIHKYIAIVENYISIIENYIFNKENTVDEYVKKLNTYKETVRKCADEVTLKCKRGKSDKESISYINFFIMCLLNRTYEIDKEYVNYMMITKKLFGELEEKLNKLKSFCIKSKNNNLLSGLNEGSTFSNFNNFVNQCEELQAEDTVIGDNLTCGAMIDSFKIYHNDCLNNNKSLLDDLITKSKYISKLKEDLILFVGRFEREGNGSIKYKLFNGEGKIDLLNKDEDIEMFCLYELYNKKVQLSYEESNFPKFLELLEEYIKELTKLNESYNNGSTDVNIQNKINELKKNIGVIEQRIKTCKNKVIRIKTFIPNDNRRN